MCVSSDEVERLKNEEQINTEKRKKRNEDIQNSISYMAGVRKKMAQEYNDMGIILFKDGQRNNAIKFFEESIKMYKNNYNLQNISFLYYKLSEFDKALEYINQSIEFKQTDENLRIKKEIQGIINKLEN